MGVEERKGGMFARPQKILPDGREDSITMVCMISACLWEGGCVGPSGIQIQGARGAGAIQGPSGASGSPSW